jgi:hypothetical protein
MCRQKAAEPKQSAAKAKDPFIKRAFEEVAAACRILTTKSPAISQPLSIDRLAFFGLRCFLRWMIFVSAQI